MLASESVLITVVVPAYNEERFVGHLLKSLVATLDQHYPKQYEVIVIDDCSTDGTRKAVEDLDLSAVSLIRHKENLGKGAAVQSGIRQATGHWILVQDADFEYSPDDIPELLACAQRYEPCAVYGSRTLGSRRGRGLRRKLGLWPRQAMSSWAFGWVLTGLFFVKHRAFLTDHLTGYKLYPKSLFDEWTPGTQGFETDHEITLKILANGIPIFEVPIAYTPRSKAEGKKIKASDAVRALSLVSLGTKSGRPA